MNPCKCTTCANYKPGTTPPFPQALRTHQLKKGMVVRDGNTNSGPIYVITEDPGDQIWLQVLSTRPGGEPIPTKISLRDHGCQPYDSGRWNPTWWLREVK